MTDDAGSVTAPNPPASRKICSKWISVSGVRFYEGFVMSRKKKGVKKKDVIPSFKRLVRLTDKTAFTHPCYLTPNYAVLNKGFSVHAPGVHAASQL